MRVRGIRKLVTRYGDSFEGDGSPDGMPVRHMVIIALVELLLCGLWLVALALAGAIE